MKIVGELPEWSETVVSTKAAELGMSVEQAAAVKKGLLTVLKRFTEGEARTIVDTCDNGAEALYRLNSRCCSRTVMLEVKTAAGDDVA